MSKEPAYQSVIEFAAQTGRLDFLSAVLAVLALILGVGAFPVFWFLRRRAADVAREEIKAAMENMEQRVEEAAISKMEQLLPRLMEEYGEFAKNAVEDDTANRIAQAQGEEEAEQ